MVMEPGQKQLKKVFCDLQTFLTLLTDTCKIDLNGPYFYITQFENIVSFALSVYFLCTNLFIWREKNHMVCIFSVMRIFLLPSHHVAEKMSLSHANENERYILYFVLLKINDYRFL